jgi:protoporphyrinogen oxidase
LFTSVLPNEDWNILEGNFKDVAGIFFNSRLQTLTPYPDLRNFPESQLREWMADLFSTIKKNFGQQLKADANAYEILTHHFGSAITDSIFVPILEKLYLHHPTQLDEIATQLTAINRIALFDEPLMRDLMQSAELRSRVCYPNQFTLPDYRANKQRGLYPKKYGMAHVLDRIKKDLEKQHCTFLTGCQITSLEVDGQQIKNIHIKTGDEVSIINNTQRVYWTAGLPPLALALKVDISKFRNDKREMAYYVNILFDKNPEMESLYYFYCFDKNFRTFRVTNYTNYCPAAAEGRGYPVCVELWPVIGDSQTDDDLLGRAVSELTTFGIIDSTIGINFAKVEKVHGGGFPLPTLNNISNLDQVRSSIKNLNIQNLTITGVMAEKNVFFIKDVLVDTYEKVCNS